MWLPMKLAPHPDATHDPVPVVVRVKDAAGVPLHFQNYANTLFVAQWFDWHNAWASCGPVGTTGIAGVQEDWLVGWQPLDLEDKVLDERQRMPAGR